MPNEPKIKVEDLKKDDDELDDADLEPVAGGLAATLAKKGASVTRASDPDSGEELV